MNSIKWTKIIGVYQLIGGVLGLILMIPYYRFENTQTVVFSLLPILLFSFSIFAGLKLYQLTPLGKAASIWNQAFQLFSMAIGTFYYSFASGVCFLLTLDLTGDLKIGFRSGASMLSMVFQGTEAHYYFGINLVPILLMIALERMKLKSKSADMNSGYPSKQTKSVI
jgi:hypothetical protein